jgi:hypothetical protein
MQFRLQQRGCVHQYNTDGQCGFIAAKSNQRQERWTKRRSRFAKLHIVAGWERTSLRYARRLCGTRCVMY